MRHAVFRASPQPGYDLDFLRRATAKPAKAVTSSTPPAGSGTGAGDISSWNCAKPPSEKKKSDRPPDPLVSTEIETKSAPRRMVGSGDKPAAEKMVATPTSLIPMISRIPPTGLLPSGPLRHRRTSWKDSRSDRRRPVHSRHQAMLRCFRTRAHPSQSSRPANRTLLGNRRIQWPQRPGPP